MIFLLVVVSLAAAVLAKEPIFANYHEEIGIPEARRIWLAESAMDFDGSRIIGGSVSDIGQFPYLGGLVVALTDGRISVCGSSLISSTKLVTAAHCWNHGDAQARQFTVVLGSLQLFSGGTRIETDRVKMHGSYDEENLNNDVAVITIPAVSFNNLISRVILATGNNQYVGATATAAGFGRTRDGANIPNDQILRHVSMQVISNADCQSIYGSSVVIGSTLCTDTAQGTRSTCGGDTGGPLTVGSGNNLRLIGINSFGPRAGCQSGGPAGFARVSSFASWIILQ